MILSENKLSYQKLTKFSTENTLKHGFFLLILGHNFYLFADFNILKEKQPLGNQMHSESASGHLLNHWDPLHCDINPLKSQYTLQNHQEATETLCFSAELSCKDVNKVIQGGLV